MSDSAQPSRAHFEAQYIEFAGWPAKAASLETMTIRPRLWARNVGRSWRVSSSTPKKFGFHHAANLFGGQILKCATCRRDSGVVHHRIECIPCRQSYRESVSMDAGSVTSIRSNSI